MPRRKPPPGTPWTTSPDDVEAAFYEALLGGNLDALMALWAEDEEVVCIHPGGQRLDGLDAIRDGFAQLLGNGGLQIAAEVRHRWLGLSCATHSVIERLQIDVEGRLQWGYVLATNFYVQTPAGWRIALHHASPGATQSALDALGPGEVLH